MPMKGTQIHAHVIQPTRKEGCYSALPSPLPPPPHTLPQQLWDSADGRTALHTLYFPKSIRFPRANSYICHVVKSTEEMLSKTYP